MRFKIISNRTKKVICNKAKVAETLLSRTIGLMFSKKMQGFDGLLIKQCNSIHTFFMKYPIDVVFLSKDYMVIDYVKKILPWRMTWMRFKASQVLELESEEGRDLEINIGDKLEVICIK